MRFGRLVKFGLVSTESSFGRFPFRLTCLLNVRFFRIDVFFMWKYCVVDRGIFLQPREIVVVFISDRILLA